MSNVILDSVLVINETYKLSALPSRLSKVWKSVPNLELNDDFKYIGNSHIVNADFIHLKTGKTCSLPTHLLMNSDRFYYPSNERLALKTALIICSDTTLYPYGTSKKSLRQPVKVGTIFTSYVQEANYYIVKDNAGNQFRAYMSSSRPIMDIEYTEKLAAPLTQNENSYKLSHVDIDTEDKEISIVTTYSVLGESFTNETDAAYVANLLKALKTHTFKSTKDFESFQVLVKDLSIDVASA